MNVLILLLAGKSERVNSTVKKQFIKVDGKPLFMHAFNEFYVINKIHRYVLVISPEDEEIVNKSLGRLKDYVDINLVYGGNSRQESVNNALRFLKDKVNDNTNILIHDAARPLVSKKLILDVLKNLETHSAVVPAIDVYDSIAKSEHDVIEKYLNREDFKLIQTPQGFKYKEILNAHERFKDDLNYTDDASLLLAQEKNITLIKGYRINFKVTTNEDLKLVRCILEVK